MLYSIAMPYSILCIVQIYYAMLYCILLILFTTIIIVLFIMQGFEEMPTNKVRGGQNYDLSCIHTCIYVYTNTILTLHISLMGVCVANDYTAMYINLKMCMLISVYSCIYMPLYLYIYSGWRALFGTSTRCSSPRATPPETRTTPSSSRYTIQYGVQQCI